VVGPLEEEPAETMMFVALLLLLALVPPAVATALLLLLFVLLSPMARGLEVERTAGYWDFMAEATSTAVDFAVSSHHPSHSEDPMAMIDFGILLLNCTLELKC
jgi:hypothetical protein